MSGDHFFVCDGGLHDPWTRAIHLGYAWQLVNPHVQDQIRLAKRELGFSYGRINGILSDRMMLRTKQSMHITNNYYLEDLL